MGACCPAQGTQPQPAALRWPRGADRRLGEGGSRGRESMCAYNWFPLLYAKLTYYKVIILQFCFFNKKKKLLFFLLVLQDCFCKGNPLSLSWFADVMKLLPAYFAQFLLATVSKNLYIMWHFSSQHFWECLLYIASDYVSTLWITSFCWTKFHMPITHRGCCFV